MTQPTISNLQQKIIVDQVGSVAVTDVVIDKAGTALREIRVLGPIDADNNTPPLVFTLRLSSPTPGNILIATPAASF